jgi:hypothetical protein
MALLAGRNTLVSYLLSGFDHAGDAAGTHTAAPVECHHFRLLFIRSDRTRTGPLGEERAAC